MVKRFSYADAVRLLGGPGPAGAVLDRVLGGALLVGGLTGAGLALNLFDAKAELVRSGQAVLSAMRDRMRGVARFDRTQGLQAAHTVVVVTAYFEAMEFEGLPFGLAEVELTRGDQLRLVDGQATDGSWVEGLLNAELPQPAPEFAYETTVERIHQLYVDTSKRFITYVGALAFWEGLDETTRARATRRLREELPGRAVERYEAMHRRLALNVPEFGLWVRQSDDTATRIELRQGLRRLEELLGTIISGRTPEGIRASLSAAYRAELAEPILGTSADSGQLVMPALGEIYVDPTFRVRVAGPGDRPSDEGWWAEVAARDDLPAFLALHLGTERAVEVPLLVLGQPGAGKSALTRVLAARLPAADFLSYGWRCATCPPRPSSRTRSSMAMRAAIGEPVGWPELARSAAGALPVVLLDGFDELLQATGVHQSDYLVRVAAFQRREAVLGRPVAVVVTSRIAVADRARLPEGSLVRASGAVRRRADRPLAGRLERGQRRDPAASGLRPLPWTARRFRTWPGSRCCC